MRKLTLSAEADVIEQAKRLAAEQKTSVSAMFARFIRGVARRGKSSGAIPKSSIAVRATGVVSLPRGKAPRDILVEALEEKYGCK
jgi:hypothetical protein